MFYTITAHSTREQLEALQTLRSYTHQVKVLLTQSSQHFEQLTGRHGQLTVAGHLQRQIEIPATSVTDIGFG